MPVNPLNNGMSIFLLAQFLFWNGQAVGELLTAHHRTGTLLTDCIVMADTIITKAGLNLFQVDLNQEQTGCDMYLQIKTSNISLFPADFFEPYNVVALQLLDCSMSSVPYDLISPICSDNLGYFEISNLVLTNLGLQLTPGGFENCTGLQELWLQNVIHELPSDAFRGLDNLKELTLQQNQIQRVDVGFEGLKDTLEYLNMAVNPISSVPKDAFEGWTKMTLLVLSGSKITTLEQGTFDSLGPSPSVVLAADQLDCDCDLQWLQDWYKQNPIDVDDYHDHGFTNDPRAVCATPINVTLANFNYESGPYKCNHTTVVTDTTEVTEVTEITDVTEVTDVTTGSNGAQQVMSFGILAILVMSFIPHQMF